jgi:hypothetical protein
MVCSLRLWYKAEDPTLIKQVDIQFVFHYRNNVRAFALAFGRILFKEQGIICG